MLGTFMDSPIIFLISLVGIVFSITIHEFAHAWMADKLGDPTPRMQGRVTLNPLKHLDPLGTIALLIFRFGWGKPVEFDPYNLKNPVKDSAMVALAGPAVNLLTAGLISLALHASRIPELMGFALYTVLLINVVLAIFNLIPVHPLDGSKIILPLLPRPLAIEYEEFMHRYGIYVLLLLIFPWYQGQSPASFLIWPVVEKVVVLLAGGL